MICINIKETLSRLHSSINNISHTMFTVYFLTYLKRKMTSGALIRNHILILTVVFFNIFSLTRASSSRSFSSWIRLCSSNTLSMALQYIYNVYYYKNDTLTYVVRCPASHTHDINCTRKLIMIYIQIQKSH